MRNDYVQINKYTRPGTKLTKVKKIVMHWTANPGASAANHVNYFGKSLIEQNEKLPENKRRYASAHIFVDDKEAICIVPLSEVAYHANEGSTKKIPHLRPNANYFSIGIEMCVEKNGKIARETFARAADVAADLCKRFGLSETDVVRHFDVTGKSCPTPWITKPDEFVRFKKSVKARLGNNKKEITNKERCTVSIRFTNTSKKTVAFKEFLASMGLQFKCTQGTSTEKFEVLFAPNSTKYVKTIEYLNRNKISFK